MPMFEFESGTFQLFLPLSFILCGESRLLVSWCASGRCGMTGSDEDHGSSRKPSADDQSWSHMSSTWWPDDREVGTLCAVCNVHMKMRSTGFLVRPQNQGRRFVSGLTSKSLR
jgi:hypothetical protein